MDLYFPENKFVSINNYMVEQHVLVSKCSSEEDDKSKLF
jgi:hypothetical protein